MVDDSSTAAVRVRRSHRKGQLRRRRKIKRAVVEVEEDSISSLPDVILQHILCFIPTKLAIRTSLLSKRWRHVWCDIPSLSLYADKTTAASINETLARYTAPKMMNFYLKSTKKENIPHINTWIKCAMSHNVENLSLDFWTHCSDVEYELPNFFYINSSVKQITFKLDYSNTMIPRCSVSWTSLQKLSLRFCSLSDESIAKILSGCPLLESLTLYFCDELKVLDLSKSLRLTTLEVDRSEWVSGPAHIVAPHIHCLKLRNCQLPCTLVDVSSLTEAKLDICFASTFIDFKADFLQDMVLKMLEKLQNAEKLTLRGNFIQILSLAEIRGVPFPKFKVKTLTLETAIFRYVIPGIERLVQNSPALEKITVRARDCNTLQGDYLDEYLKLQGLNPDQCWRSKDGVFWSDYHWDLESKHVTSFVELMLKNTKTLDKMVLLLNEFYLKLKFEELVPTLSHNTNVSIARLITEKPIDDW